MEESIREFSLCLRHTVAKVMGFFFLPFLTFLNNYIVFL